MLQVHPSLLSPWLAPWLSPRAPSPSLAGSGVASPLAISLRDDRENAVSTEYSMPDRIQYAVYADLA